MEINSLFEAASNKISFSKFKTRANEFINILLDAEYSDREIIALCARGLPDFEPIIRLWLKDARDKRASCTSANS